jgi:hypothetical protein
VEDVASDAQGAPAVEGLVMAVELTVVLRFETQADAGAFRDDVESEFECDIVAWEEEDV